MLFWCHLSVQVGKGEGTASGSQVRTVSPIGSEPRLNDSGGRSPRNCGADIPRFPNCRTRSNRRFRLSLSFPEWLSAKICRANSIEGLNPEINRRRPLDIVHRESAVFRVVGTWLLEQNDEWAVAQSGLILTDLGNVGDAEKHDSGPV